MAQTRDIKRRIKSVANTTKITRTMELIATAKSQQCQGRIRRALPYFQALAEIAGEARKGASEDEGGAHPLLEQRDVKTVAILVVAANRGLCGGYNGNTMRLARRRRQELLDQGKQVVIVASGKKAINWLRFQGIAYDKRTYTQFEDRPAYAEVEKVADHMLGLFLDRQVDQVEVVYTHYFSAGRQAPVIETVLPIAPPAQVAKEAVPTGTSAAMALARAEQAGESAPKSYASNFIIEPDPRSILDALFPLQAKLHLYRVYLEAATSEQIARRIAMKNATDNAEEVSRALRMAYNRARQSQITKEILEVLGGAEALA